MNVCPGLRSRTGVQIGEQTSGAGMVFGNTDAMQAEPGSHAMLRSLHLPCTQMLPVVRRPLPCVAPVTLDAQSVNTGELQSSLFAHGPPVPSGVPRRHSGQWRGYPRQ